MIYLQYFAQTNPKTTTANIIKTKEKTPNPNKPDHSINFISFPLKQTNHSGFKAVFQVQNISRNKTEHN